MEVSTFDAKNQLSALLGQVEKGVEVTITRRGVPVAMLVPVKPVFDQAAARAAAAGLRAARQGVTLGGAAVKELIDDGRR